jgi:cephalosporin hydroxylase
VADITKLSSDDVSIVDAFHRLHYPYFREPRWLGVQAAKCPFDLFVYQEIIWEVRPDLIIECGTYAGGSAIFLASICELLKHGEVVTIDVAPAATPKFPRLTYWRGDSLASETIERARRLIGRRLRRPKAVLVILDDDHMCDHVLKELRVYSQFVTPGSYLIVEDTNINGHPVLPEFGPGPMEAVELFLQDNPEFEVDRSREKYLVSFNPKGFLRRVHPSESPNR